MTLMALHIKIFKEASDKYRAEIAGGWWVAISKTQEGAIKNVMARYEKERDSR